MLHADTLYRFYRAGDEETLAVRGVSLQLLPGEVVALSGPSGSGKSTLLACLAGTDEPSGGTVWVDGVRMSGRSEAARAALRARYIGTMAQSGNLVAHLCLADNLRLANRISGRRGDGRGLLEELDIAHRARAWPHQLSGGELARASLALALANAPTVLLADEPTGELDEATEAPVARPGPGPGRGRLRSPRGQPQRGRTPDGRSRPAPRRRRAGRMNAGSDPLLVLCERASRTFGHGRTAVVAVHDVSCGVSASSRVALVGPSGSGKSTLVQLMAGLDRPTSGTVAWPAWGSGPLHDPSRAGVVFQGPSLIPSLSAVENVAFPLLLRGVGRDQARREPWRPWRCSASARSRARCPTSSPGARRRGSRSRGS